MHARNDLAVHAATSSRVHRSRDGGSSTHAEGSMHGGVAMWKVLEASEVGGESTAQHTEHVEVRTTGELHHEVDPNSG